MIRKSFGRRNWMRCSLVALMCTSLSGCEALLSLGDESYRFRMNVEVETPDGVKTGSAVYEVTAGKRLDLLPETPSHETSVRGEAIALDISEGKTLFALLKTNAHFKDMISLSSATLDPQFAEKPYAVAASVKRLGSKSPDSSPVEVDPENYPLLVTFSRPRDPTSVQLVDPENLAIPFGEGVSLRRITVQLTNDKVTSTIGGRLSKLGIEHDLGLDRSLGTSANPTLAQQLGYSDFKKN